MPFDGVFVYSFQDRLAGEFGHVVTDDTGGFAIDPHQRIQFPRRTVFGSTAIRTQAGAERSDDFPLLAVLRPAVASELLRLSQQIL